MNLFLSLYGMAWTAAMPFLRRNKRLAEGFSERLAPPGWPWTDNNSRAGDESSNGNGLFTNAKYHNPRPTGPVVWVQAASGGEAALVRELAKALAAGLPCGSPLTLLATTFTRQGMDILEKIDTSPERGLSVIPRYFPLDGPATMERALAQAAPDCIVLLETELWPGLMEAARKANVPVLVLNGRITPKSLSRYTWLSSFWKSRRPEQILAISSEDAGRYGQLFGHDNVKTVSNIKFDGVLAQAGQVVDANSVWNEAGIPQSDRVITLASVRQEEENLLKPVIDEIIKKSPHRPCNRLFIAPRHLHRVEAWKTLLPQAELFSQIQTSEKKKEADIIIWDVFGRLKELYAASDAVFVGGSLAPLGGQNFLEPLAQGLCPVIGPYWKNFSWVGESIFEEGLVTEVKNPSELAVALCNRTQKESAAGRSEVRDRFLKWLAPHTGGSSQSAAAIFSVLDKRGLC